MTEKFTDLDDIIQCFDDFDKYIELKREKNMYEGYIEENDVNFLIG